MSLLLFFKSHVDSFTRKDGSVVAAHERHTGTVHSVKNTMSGYRVINIDGTDHATLDSDQDWKVGDKVSYKKQPTEKFMGTAIPHRVSDIKKHV